MNKINIGLCGLGTVGTGVVKILREHQEELFHQTGCSLEVKKILVNNIEKERELQIAEDVLTTDVTDIVNDDSIDVVIEVMGGLKSAYELVGEALKNGKHVVTANKDMLAEYGSEIFHLASKHNRDIFYEASVAGGIPIIRTLKEGLIADRINQLMGIVNGTTNYILTKMDEEERQFDDVLKEAQELGFAEADPSADIDGLDAARKIALMSTLSFSMPIDLKDVDVKGIRNIELEDLKLAKQLGYTMKLLGFANRHNGRVEVSVEPVLLQSDHPLTSVKNEYNAVYVYSDAVGETMFYGPGAGSLPTASAVVSDLIGVVKNISLGTTGKSYVKPLYEKELQTDEEMFGKYFFRLEVDDIAGTFLEITNIYTNADISFAKISQVPDQSKGTAEIILVTHQASKAKIHSVIQQITDLPAVRNLKSVYRVEEGE
ncbi:homoserine dehydrogenase [Salirhabdus salicampi]|uniref:homoserine dehydrogenase n=1 Tax=Salirhabdus salicampi TaxID=476102 RepID=UPI0020C48DD6|nr:homoserine dehydrogenase [Salirhabdus salicampi]MCP8617757.1 homoserine dehydrogenase [Salirhabdus salicampi]